MTIKSLSSRDNPLYKELKLLATSSQARRNAGRTLLDGIHLCEAYLQLVGSPALCIISDQAQAHPDAAAVFERCTSLRTPCIVLSAALFHALSQVAHGSDLLFVIDTPQPTAPLSIAQDAVLRGGGRDPSKHKTKKHNTTTAGIRQVYCSPGTVFAWSP